jgi:hypothetical protein
MFDFMLTRSEADAWEAMPDHAAERARPIEERRRRYYVNHFPEVRLFRYRPRMASGSGRPLPERPGLMAYERLPVRHYRSRDPAQLRARCALRAILREFASGRLAQHWALDWQSFVWPDEAPTLKTLGPGESLPEFKSTRAAAGTLARRREQFYYKLRLADLADRLRRPRPPTDLIPIPDMVQSRLAAAIGGAEVPA